MIWFVAINAVLAIALGAILVLAVSGCERAIRDYYAALRGKKP